MLLRIGNGDARRRGDVPGSSLALAALAQVHDHRLVILAGEHDALDVEQDLGDVFLNTRQSGELMQGSGDTHGGHGSTRDRTQQRATQRVTERVAEARLERLDGEARALRIQRFLGQSRTLCNKHCGYPFSLNSVVHSPAKRFWMDWYC